MKQTIIILFILPIILFAQPYVFSGGKDNIVQIIASKILEKAYQKANLEMEPIFMPLEESLQRSNTGKTDGELGRIAKINKLYPNLLQVPVSVASVEAVAFSKDTTLNIQNWDDLIGHKLTIIKGAKFIELGTKGIDKESVISFAEAIERLKNDQTEIVVAPKLAGVGILHKKRYQDIKTVSPTIQRLKLYHFVHKKNSHLIPIITPILQEMKQNGEIDYIRNSYLRSITR